MDCQFLVSDVPLIWIFYLYIVLFIRIVLPYRNTVLCFLSYIKTLIDMILYKPSEVTQ